MSQVLNQTEQQRARERTQAFQNILSGGEKGATQEIEQMSLEAEQQLKQQFQTTGSKAAGHAADFLEAQRKMVKSKDLGDRFLRIANRLEELRRNASGPDASQVNTELARLQREMENLRPLLRLVVRSDEFRKALISAVRVAKHVLEQNMEGDLEKVLEKGEKEGVQSGVKEAQKAMNKTVDNIVDKADKNKKVISDKDWEKLSSELDALFRQFQSHSEWRRAVDHLFSLASSISTQVKETTRSREVEGVKKEAKDLVAQFSGEESLDRLSRSLSTLRSKLENNRDAEQWWNEFKDHTLRVSRNFEGEEDINKYRELFNRGFDIFQEYRDQVNEILDNMSEVMDNISNDEFVLRLRESVSALSDDLFWQDPAGNRYFDAAAGGVLASTVSDVIRNQFRSLALPRVVKQEENMAYTLDNLIISATLPDKIDFHLESYASLDTSSFSVPGQSSLQSEIYLTARIRGITAVAPDIHFTYQGRTLSEAGVMSIRIPEPGATLYMDFVLRPVTSPAISAASAPTSFSTTTGMEKGGVEMTVGGGFMRYEFLRIKSHFSVPDLEIDYNKNTLSHSFLTPLITSMWKARIIDRFETGIEESLDSGLVTLGQNITKILNQAPNPLSIASFGSMITAV